MNLRYYAMSHSRSAKTSKVIRNTYALLGSTLLFSAVVAYISMLLRLPHPGFFGTLVGFYGLYFLAHYNSENIMGLVTAFLFTGFTGYTLGPLLTVILQFYANGSAIISMAFTMTAVVFLSLSGYVMVSQKEFNYLGGVISVGAIVAIIAALFSFIFPSALMEIIVSSLFALISSGYILYHTSEIIHGGETNCVVATLALYISIYNLFISFLRLFMMFAGNRR